MKSMTGYAQTPVSTPQIRATIVAKSYNNRFLDAYVSVPPYLAALEPKIREAIAGVMAHGKVEFNIRVHDLSVAPTVSVDRASAQAVADALRCLRDSAGIVGELVLSDLVAFEGVITFDREIDAEGLWNEIQPSVLACLDSLDAERKREGEATRRDVERLIASVSNHVKTVESHADELESTIRSGLAKKFRDVLGDEVEESRMLVEIASYLAKHTINEEIVRLRSHLESFTATMDERACGKKLDFICQEMNREINTIGSKNMLSSVGLAVVSMKDDLENIREQIRNVE
ncbi:MAG: YicC family protein [Spirochaetes bacterium]|nr:YicC family protein [Spirochaetota bacterium]